MTKLEIEKDEKKVLLIRVPVNVLDEMNKERKKRKLQWAPLVVAMFKRWLSEEK